MAHCPGCACGGDPLVEAATHGYCALDAPIPRESAWQPEPEACIIELLKRGDRWRVYVKAGSMIFENAEDDYRTALASAERMLGEKVLGAEEPPTAEACEAIRGKWVALCCVPAPATGRSCTKDLGHEGDHSTGPLLEGLGMVEQWAQDPVEERFQTRVDPRTGISWSYTATEHRP